MAYSKELFEYGREILNRQPSTCFSNVGRTKTWIIRLRAKTGTDWKRTEYDRVCCNSRRDVRQTGIAAVRTNQGKESFSAERAPIYSRSIDLPEDYLTEPFTCPLCHDEGYRDGKRCKCFEKILKEEALRRLNSKSPLALCHFSNFDLSYYADTANNGPSRGNKMKKIFRFCRVTPKHFLLMDPIF